MDVYNCTTTVARFVINEVLSAEGVEAQASVIDHYVQVQTDLSPIAHRAGGTRRQHETREREMFYLTTHSTHFIYGYTASDIWLRTILIVRKETRCRHIGYSYRLTVRVLLYAPSHRQDNTYHGLCYTSRGALAGTRNSSMGHETITHSASS